MGAERLVSDALLQTKHARSHALDDDVQGYIRLGVGVGLVHAGAERGHIFRVASL